MNEPELLSKIIALLFSLGRPLTYQELSNQLGESEEALRSAILSHQSTALAIVDDGRTVELRVSKVHAAMVEEIRKEEFSKEIGRAGMEVLCAVIYRGPLSRSEIDFIRGVNSSQTIRTLTMRGLVRKSPNPKDERSFLYEPTTELLAQLGVERVDELPDFVRTREELVALESAYRARESAS